MVRPCVARGFRRDGGRVVLHQCIRLLIGACCAPSHHGYQRACGLISGPASNGPFGSPVLACAGKTDPPSRLVLSQTSAGKRVARLWWSSCVRRSSDLGTHLIDLAHLEVPPPSEDAPGDARKLIGERDRQNIVV